MVRTKDKFLSKLVVLFFLAAIVIGQKGISVRAENHDRVLFISSYSYGWDTVQMQIDGIKDTLGPQVTLDYEFMDTKRVDTEASRQLFYAGLKYRLSVVEPYDAIIVGDDAALMFVLEYREELFAGVPIVFEGVNDEELARRSAEEPLITGVIEKLSVESNIDLGLKLIPDATQVVAILDNTITGQAERERFYSYAEKYPQLTFTEINTSELSSAKLRLELASLDKDSILIYVVMTEDANGKQYSSQEAVHLISETANVPCFRMVEAGIGEGLLGGNVVSMYKSGEIAAQMAIDIMDGKNDGNIPEIAESPNVYCIDEQVMEKFELNQKLLPEETTIVNHELSWTEKYEEILAPIGFVVTGLLLVIAFIVFDNIRHRNLVQEIKRAKGIMEAASQHDFLTGLPNRSKFMEDIQQIIDDKEPCVVMMVDIDEFKKINDTMGHTAGDEALKQVADRLKIMQSQILTPYRFAGDEFIVILKSNQQMLIDKAAFQCKDIFTKPCILNGKEYPVCGSIGIAAYPKDTDNLEQLIVCADAAMYQVKKSGKNNFAFYSKENCEEA